MRDPIEMDEKDAQERNNDLAEAEQLDRQSLIRAGHNLIMWADLTPAEGAVLQRMLAVFDPPKPVEEEPDIPF